MMLTETNSGKLVPDRKFFIAIFFSVVSSVALFWDKVSGGEFVALVTAILTLYGAANVATKSVISHSTEKKNATPPVNQH